MAYPPTIPPPSRVNTTPQVNLHPADHNDISTALTDVVNELGTNPSGAQTTVEARLAAVDTKNGEQDTTLASHTSTLASHNTRINTAQAKADQAYNDAWAINAALGAQIATKAVISSQIAGSGLGNNGLAIRAGSAVVTLSGFGTAFVNFAAAMPNMNFVLVTSNGGTETANGAATVGVRFADTTTTSFNIQCERTSGVAANGAFRVNYIAIGTG